VNLWGSSDNLGGWGPWGGGWRTGTVQGQTSTISVGTLMVDVYDLGKKQLIWRGDASKTIDLNKDPDKNYKNLQKAMAKLRIIRLSPISRPGWTKRTRGL